MITGSFDLPDFKADARTMMRVRNCFSIVITELQHTRNQLQFVAGLLAISIILDLLDPALLLITRVDSLVYRAAGGTSIGAGIMAAVFLLLALSLTPFLVLQCGWARDRRRRITQEACAALAVAGIAWAFLGWRCLHLNLGVVAQLVLFRNGAGALLFSLALALSLNAEQLAEQLRNLMERPQ